jgi:hypothetical protein
MHHACSSQLWLCLTIGFFCARPLACAREPIVDNWDDALRITTVLRNGRPVFDREEMRNLQTYRNPQVALSFSTQKAGAFSIIRAPKNSDSADGFAFELPTGFETSLTADALEVTGWLHGAPAGRVDVAFLNADGTDLGRSGADLPPPDADGWQQWSAKLTLPSPPKHGTRLAIAFQTQIPAETAIDGVEIRQRGRVLGITDRPVSDWVRQAEANHEHRIRSAIEAGARTDAGGRDRQIFDQLWLGQDLVRNNEELREWYRKELANPSLHSLTEKMRLFMTYYELGSRGRCRPVRLEPATEQLLLELLWRLTSVTNDIANSRMSTWWLTSSENHDLNGKASSLLSSRIFMEEPSYRNRMYPDLGRGPGYGHWQHLEQGEPGPPGEGYFKDGKSYRAAEHHAAWVGFFRDYIAQRVKHGFFVENGAPGYMKYTLAYLQALHAYGGDAELKREIGQFLDLVWADWAQIQLAGVRGGPKTRHHNSVGGYDAMTVFARFFLGGPGSTDAIYGVQLFDDYRWPDVVWSVALDTPGRGAYEIVQRGTGEEQPTRPRPPGLERSMLINPDSKIVKTAWVTPDYILGTQMDHPDAIHTHLNTTGRWQGFTCADPAARIVPCSAAKRNGDADLEFLMQSVQHRSSLVTQQARRWHQISPVWFPSQPLYQKPAAVFVGKAWDETASRNGWFFVRKGNAYAAIRIVAGERDASARNPAFGKKRPGVLNDGDATIAGDPRRVRLAERTWEWGEDGTVMVPNDKFSPIVIEAGRRADYGRFAAFQEAVLAAKLELLKTVVPGFHLLRYKGPARDAAEIRFNAATTDIPMIDGKPVEYDLAKTHASPFLQSIGDGGVIIRKDGSQLRVSAAAAAAHDRR